MSKNPAFQLYTNDWARDLEEHPLEIEGAWIRICCKLSWADERGELTKTLLQWSRILRCGVKKSFKVLTYLQQENIASVSPDRLQNESGFLIKVMSRRMVRDEKIKKQCQIAGHKGGSPKLGVNYNKEGFVYLIKANGGLLKIGISTNPQKRLNKIKTSFPDAELIDKKWVGDMGKHEAFLHDRYKEYKDKGEWFNIPKSELPLKGILKGTLPPSSSSSSSSKKIKDKERSTSLFSPEDFIELWNISFVTSCKATKGRVNKIKARIKEQPDYDYWLDIMNKINMSHFLNGSNDRNWKADLDWLIANDTNHVKIAEGKYENRETKPKKRRPDPEYEAELERDRKILGLSDEDK